MHKASTKTQSKPSHILYHRPPKVEKESLIEHEKYSSNIRFNTKIHIHGLSMILRVKPWFLFRIFEALKIQACQFCRNKSKFVEKN